MSNTSDPIEPTNNQKPDSFSQSGIGTSTSLNEQTSGATASQGQKRDQARDFGSTGQRADQAASGVGERLESLAEGIREKAPQGGMAGQASSAVADKIERTGRYLEEHGLQDIADDLTDVIRRNPIPAVLIGIGIGFLLGRALAPRA